MKEDSKDLAPSVETQSATEGPCAGGMPQNERVFRKLKSVKDGRVRLRMPIVKERPFDPTAWYIYRVKRLKELESRDFLNSRDLGFPVEAYVAVQSSVRRKSSSPVPTRQEKVVIHGKLFVRVDEAHRVKVMKQCPLITECVTNASRYIHDGKPTTFVRIPDKQILQIREILDKADGVVTYTEQIPEVHDNIQVIGGLISRSSLFNDVKGEIVTVNGRKSATVILDGIGCFRWKLPLNDLAKHLAG